VGSERAREPCGGPDVCTAVARRDGGGVDPDQFHRCALSLYRQLAAETKAAFNQKFFHAQTGGNGSQTADAVALRFGITPEGQGDGVAKSLRAEIVDQHQGHAFVGIHGGKPLYTQLCENGFEDVAIAAMKQKTWPSYAYTLAQGFTTWPEQMDELNPVERIANRSLNHPMQSGFAAWFHESVGGIRPAAPGFKRIELKPHGFTQIAWAKVEHDLLYGPIKSYWRSENDLFKWSIAIPANTTATISVPAQNKDGVMESGRPAEASSGVKFLRFEGGRAVYEVESGNFMFQSRL